MRGVVVMAYGTPRTPDEVEAYYTDIRRGRPPTAEQLADLVRRYDAIGGISPLAARTEAQRAALADALGDGYVVVTGLRHAEPSIEHAVATLVEAGVERIVGLVLAPHFSSMSVGAYHERAGKAAAHAGRAYTGVRSWATDESYVAFLADAVSDRLTALPPATKVVFTAHSLPRRILDTGDPYPDEVAATAMAVARQVGLDRWGGWSTAWQSAGRTAEPWLGPDILGVIETLAASGEAAGLLVCPCGFASDHLEVLYDLDIDARRRAEAVGLPFDRTAVVNADPATMASLARVIRAA